MTNGSIIVAKVTQNKVHAARFFAAASMLSLLIGMGPAHAQDMVSPVRLAQAEARMSFNIPPQSLASAVTAFGLQSGYQLSVDQDMLAGQQTQGVRGVMVPMEALGRILIGTGMTWRLIDARSVALEKAPRSGDAAIQLGPVRVESQSGATSNAASGTVMLGDPPPSLAGGQVASGAQLGMLGNRSVMDTPFNQVAYTARKAQDQQARTIKDVLIDDPSVRGQSLDGGPGVEGVTIRGFPTSISEVSYGGLYGVLPYFSPMAEVAERVEVLKGPSVLLNGMSPERSIAGTINIVPKRAPDEGIFQGTVSYLGTSQFGGHIDIGKRFGPSGELGLRFNGVYRDGNGAVRDNSDRRGLSLLGVDYRGERVRLSADFGYQYQKISGVISYIALDDGIAVPTAPDGRINQGQPWSYNEYRDIFGAARAEVDLSDNVTVYAAIGANDNRFGSLYSSIITVVGTDGAATANSPFDIEQTRKTLTGQAGFRARFRTGPIQHQLAVSGSTYSSDFGQGFLFAASSPFASNIYQPVRIPRPDVPTPAAVKVSTSDQSSVGFADTLSTAEDHVQLTLGARWQQTGAKSYSNGQVSSRYSESAVSPAVAFVVKPWQNISVYANYIQGLQPGTIAGPQYANAGDIFPPYRTRQYEVGLKIDLGTVIATASAFQIAQPNLLTDVGTNRLVLNGEQRNRGLELNLSGQPMEGVRLLGGAMFLDGKLTRTQDGANDGWRATMAPTFNLNLSGEWDLPFVEGLTVDGRVIHTSGQYFDTQAPRRRLPDWTRVDLGLRQVIGNLLSRDKQLTLRLNVENVANAHYWAGGDGLLAVGAPRTVRASISADF